MKNEPASVLSLSARARKPSTPLLDALNDYDRLQRKRFHVPAHAGQDLTGTDLFKDPFRFDLTEVEGLDVLSEPSECLLEAQEAAAKAFGVSRTFFLVNGASVGLQAALLSVLKPGEKVLVARNAHRSVLGGLILLDAQPAWFLPEQLQAWGLWGAVRLETLQNAYRNNPDAKAVVLTSPTYEGIGSDIESIAAWCRETGLFLIVDEAHGSLWPFSDQLPVSACTFPCDAVIHSLHKSGGSLTQSAMAHLPQGSRMDPDLFQQALNTLQTTSPSYLLMASLDATRALLESAEGKQRLHHFLERVKHFRSKLSSRLQIIRLFEGSSHWDPCKLYFSNPLENNEDWGVVLEADYRLAYESVKPEGVLYVASLGLAEEDFDYLKTLILSEDQRLQDLLNGQKTGLPQKALFTNDIPLLPEIVLPPRDAFFAKGERVNTNNALGRVAKETVVHCPPGIPVLMPGERILPHHLPLLPEEGVLVIR